MINKLCSHHIEIDFHIITEGIYIYTDMGNHFRVCTVTGKTLEEVMERTRTMSQTQAIRSYLTLPVLGMYILPMVPIVRAVFTMQP